MKDNNIVTLELAKEDELDKSLELLFIAKGKGGKGIGYKAWKAIEEKYPQTKVWETHTPFFESGRITRGRRLL